MRALNGIGRQKRRARGTVTLERRSESRYTAALEMEDGAMSRGMQVTSKSGEGKEVLIYSLLEQAVHL